MAIKVTRYVAQYERRIFGDPLSSRLVYSQFEATNWHWVFLSPGTSDEGNWGLWTGRRKKMRLPICLCHPFICIDGAGCSQLSLRSSPDFIIRCEVLASWKLPPQACTYPLTGNINSAEDRSSFWRNGNQSCLMICWRSRRIDGCVKALGLLFLFQRITVSH